MQSSSALFGTFSPLTPAYWADARAQLKNVRMLTLAGIITAASIVLESFPIYLLGNLLQLSGHFAGLLCIRPGRGHSGGLRQ